MARDRHGVRKRKLSAHVLNHKRHAESQVEVVQDSESQNKSPVKYFL